LRHTPNFLALRFEHDLRPKTFIHFRHHALAHVQAAENAALFGLLQGDVGKLFGAPKVLVET